MKKFPSIAAALGWAEEPDTQDGLFLQPEEAAKVEGLVLSAASAESAAADLATANTTIEELNGKLTAADSAAGIAATAATTAANRIKDLEGQVATLGKKPSGKGSVVTTPADEVVTEKPAGKVGLNHPDHPLNQMAARRTAGKKK